MRTGLVAKKLGMSCIYDGAGARIPVTILDMNGCIVVDQKTQDKHGYSAVVLGFGELKANRAKQPQKQFFAKKKLPLKKKLKEFRVSEQCLLDVGSELSASHFVVGQYVDVRGTSVGKGFAGVMKRYNFSGLRASHGVSIAHRTAGSTGQCQDPGKVFKGKKMPGHMGAKQVTAVNLKVVYVDEENSLIGVKGAVPGHDDNYVYITDAVKKALPSACPRPAGLFKEQGKVKTSSDAQDQEPKNSVEVQENASVQNEQKEG